MLNRTRGRHIATTWLAVTLWLLSTAVLVPSHLVEAPHLSAGGEIAHHDDDDAHGEDDHGHKPHAASEHEFDGRRASAMQVEVVVVCEIASPEHVHRTDELRVIAGIEPKILCPKSPPRLPRASRAPPTA